MSKISHHRFASWLLLVAAVLFLSACAATSTAPEEAPMAPAVEEVEPWDGEGLEIPLDGSSLEAWDRSMARVKAHTSESNYITLENAIDYLLMYDLQSFRDKEKLISRLDGQTGYQILERVNWRRPAPGKGPAEKGAADATIIDT